MARTPPPLTPERRANAARLAALRDGTPEALRAWAEAYDIPLIHPEDDELLLISIHEARRDEAAMPEHLRAASRRWLAANRARIVAEREAQS
jgi:hypothetical protein